MKTQLMKSGRKWSLYSAVLAAMVYAALPLTSEPAYAGTCTTTRCQELSLTCTTFCRSYGGVRDFLCPYQPTEAFCECQLGGVELAC
jgi:hypothetical protein